MDVRNEVIDKLVISGCSWSLGEMSLREDNFLHKSHPGMTEYLNYKTVNLSTANGSNWQSLYKVWIYLTVNKKVDSSCCVIIFQTDFARSAVSEEFGVDYADILENCINLQHFYTQLAEIFYIKIAELSATYNVPIYIVGALSDVDKELFSLYNSVNNVICNSWIKLLYNEHTPSLIPCGLDSTYIDIARLANRKDLSIEMIEHSDSVFTHFGNMLELDTFGPTFGDFHPSREGHKIIANKINNFFEE